MQVPVLTRTKSLYFLKCVPMQILWIIKEHGNIQKASRKGFFLYLSLSDQCVGSSSKHIGCRNEKQRELLCESVCAHFWASEELSCCQHWEEAAKIVVTDITCCSYSFDLERLGSAGMGRQRCCYCCCCLLSWETVCPPFEFLGYHNLWFKKTLLHASHGKL